MGGNDTLDGGGGRDTVDYSTSPVGVIANLGLGFAQVGLDQPVGNAERDTLISIENAVGSSFADRLTGDAGDNKLEGGAGDDTLIGGLGNDTLDGGAGTDAVTYADAAGPMVVNLATASATGAGTDLLLGIEQVVGSRFADRITGGTVAERLDGGEGNDTLAGGLGDDTLLGGAGTDTLDYKEAAVAVTVDLRDGFAQVGLSERDTISGFEVVVSGQFDDTLMGSGNADRLESGAGNDVLNGREGQDTMVGGAGDDTYYLDSAGDVVSDESGTDTIVADLHLVDGHALALADGIENVQLAPTALASGETWSVTGNDLDNLIELPSGLAALIDGGAGTDTLRIAGAQDGYDVATTPGGTTVLTAKADGTEIRVTHVERMVFTRDASALTGRVIDGYIAGATVWGDADSDGVLDPGEISTRTDASGAYTLVGTTGSLVALGGTDIATGLAFRGVLSAPAGSGVITPLTTLVDALGRAGVADPVGKVLAGFGLPTGFDLLGTDPIAAAASGDPSGRAALVAGIAVADTVALLAASLSGATGSSLASAVGTVGLTLAAHLTGSPVDLTSEAFLTALGNEAGLSPAAASATAKAAALLNVSLLEASGSADLSAALAAAQTLAQGSVATALFDAHGDAAALSEVAAGVEATLPPPSTQTHADPSLFGTLVHDASSPGGQVVEFYHGLLGRAPDALGLETWVGMLGHGASLGSVAQGFVTSSEYAATHGPISAESDAGFVSELYEIVLGRPGDAVGVAFWTDALSHGTGRGDVASALAMSAENLAQDAALLGAGVFVPDPIKADVARLYHAVMDRAPDADGLTSWSGAVAAGLSETAVAQAFLSSSEYAAAHGAVPSPETFVAGLYDGALGRAPDVGGLAFWTGALGRGESRAGVALAIGQSLEAKLHHAGNIEAGWHLS